MRLSQYLNGFPKKGTYWEGEGGRGEMNVRLPQGLTKKSFLHHKALWPLAAIMGGTMIFAVAYAFRLATRSTDVNWSKTEEPFNAYNNKQFKFFNPAGHDYSKMNNEIPDYKK